jgi:hypothetical protein
MFELKQVTSVDMLWLALQQRGLEKRSVTQLLRHSPQGKGSSSCQFHVGKGAPEFKTKTHRPGTEDRVGNRDFFSSQDELRPKASRMSLNQRDSDVIQQEMIRTRSLQGDR